MATLPLTAWTGHQGESAKRVSWQPPSVTLDPSLGRIPKGGPTTRMAWPSLEAEEVAPGPKTFTPENSEFKQGHEVVPQAPDALLP